MEVAAVKRYLPEEYLQLEEQAEFRSELIEGEIIPVAGASVNHNFLVGNFHARLLLALEDLDFAVFMSNMRVWLPQQESYTYPDVMVARGARLLGSQQQALVNPCLIVEILSDSTQGYDKTAKFWLYRSIPELVEYILVDQTKYRLEQYTKMENNQWLLTNWVGEGTILRLQSVPFEINFKDLYKRVALSNLNSEYMS